MSASTPPQGSHELEDLLHYVAQAAIDDKPSDAFLRSFQTAAGNIAPAMFGAINDPSARRAAIGQFGRMLWSAMPKPNQGWRAVPLPKPERNGPCPCGSGRKFKQCCQPFEAPMDTFTNLNMFRFVVDLWPETKLHEVPLQRINPEALADAARQWHSEGDAERGIRLLERLFEDTANLDDRHESCFDALCDLYLDTGMQDEREKFVARIAVQGNKHLASAALQRAATLASDVGDYESAWEHFGRALRLTPDNPSLAALEVLVLRSEGRFDEAKARAKVWSSRLRRMNRPDYEGLIEFLEEAEDPARAMRKVAERHRPEDSAWSDLFDRVPAVELLYEIESHPLPDDTWGPGRIAVAMKPLPALARVEREWRNRFFVQKPGLTDLNGDAAGACEEFAPVEEFMGANPAAWQSFEVLDDLVLIAREWFDEDDEGYAERAVVKALTSRAVELLEMCVAGAGGGKAIVAWGVLQNRPPLRLVAQRIDALLDSPPGGDEDERELDALQAWMLELNPNDNHGYRNAVMQGYVLAGDAERAIALAGRYPNDIGDTPFDLALALFQAGRKEAAAAAWSRGAQSTPAIAATLLATNPRRPGVDKSDGENGGAGSQYEVFGGPEHAWRYRLHMHAAWTESGALAWARTLPRVPVPKRKTPPRAEAGNRTPPSPVAPPMADFASTLDETALLQSLAGHGFAVVPVHGMLTAVTLSQRRVPPSEWLNVALEFRRDGPMTGIDELNAAMQPLMGLYNCLNSALRMKRGDGYVPSSALTTAEPAQAIEWARGFMRIVEQGRAAWKDKTRTPQGKAALTTIERAAAGMVSADRLRQESAALGLAKPLIEEATWHDVLAAATRVLAAA